MDLSLGSVLVLLLDRVWQPLRHRRWISVALAGIYCRGLRGLLVEDLVLGCRWRPVLDREESSASPCVFIVQDPVDRDGWL